MNEEDNKMQGNREQERISKRINFLKNQLSSKESAVGDWKIIKIYEARMQNKPDPYDFDELVTAREEIRAEINRLQEQAE